MCGGPGCGKCGENNPTNDYYLNPRKKLKNSNQNCLNGLVSTLYRWIGIRNRLNSYLAKNEENFEIFSGNVNLKIFKLIYLKNLKILFNFLKLTLFNYKHKFLNEKISIHHQMLAKNLREINIRKKFIIKMIVNTIDLNDQYDSKRHKILKVILEKP